MVNLGNDSVPSSVGQQQAAKPGCLARDAAVVAASRMAPGGLHLLASAPCVAAPPTLHQGWYGKSDGLPLLADITTRSLPPLHPLLHSLTQASHRKPHKRRNWSLLPSATWVSLEGGGCVSDSPWPTAWLQRHGRPGTGTVPEAQKLWEIMFIFKAGKYGGHLL